jgi:fibronectin-binding autotransporter adhesin
MGTLVLSLGSLLAFGPASASAATCDFADVGSGLWHEAANWSCGHIPTTGDTAVVSTGDNASVDQNDTVPNLSLGDTGTITFTTAAEPVLTVTGAASLSAGTLTGAGTVTVAATGSFTKSTSGQLTIQTGADLVLDADGTIDGGSISLSSAVPSPGFWVNASLDVATTGPVFPTPNNNSPRIHIGSTGNLFNSAAGTASINTKLDNDGHLTAKAGTFHIGQGNSSSGSSTGIFEAQSPAVLELGPLGDLSDLFNLGAGAQIKGTGEVKLGGKTTIDPSDTVNPAILTQTGGPVSATGGMTPGTYDLQGGTLHGSVTADDINVESGRFEGGNMTVNAGGSFAKTTSGQLGLAQGNLVLNADGTIAGGSIGAPIDSVSAPSNIQINKTLTMSGGDFTSTLLDVNRTLRVNGPDGHLLMTGTGTASIAFPMVVTGRVDVASGQTFAASNGITVATDGVFAGGGQLAGNLTNSSGTVKPGASPGTMTVSGNYAQGAAGTLEAEIAGTAPATQYDVLNVSGAASLNGTLRAIHLSGFAPGLGGTFDVLTSGSRSGTFSSLDAPSLSGGNAYEVVYPGSPSFGARLHVHGSTSPPPPPPPPSPVTDNVPPETSITGGPTKLKTRKKTARATFTFASNEPGSSFECSLDGASFAACNSPTVVSARKGTHNFAVRARDAAGNLDPTPAAVSFKVKRKKRKR